MSTFPTVTFKKGALMDPHVSRLQNHFYVSCHTAGSQRRLEGIQAAEIGSICAFLRIQYRRCSYILFHNIGPIRHNMSSIEQRSPIRLLAPVVGPINKGASIVYAFLPQLLYFPLISTNILSHLLTHASECFQRRLDAARSPASAGCLQPKV